MHFSFLNKASSLHRTIALGARHNLIHDPQYAGQVRKLQKELARLIRQAGAVPDKMPLDEGIKSGLPDKAIR